jgi:hypothetical protein
MPVLVRDLSLLQNVQTVSGAHRVSYSMSTGVLSPGAKRPGREVNHSPPSSAEVKNEWSYSSSPSIRLHSMDRDNFALTFKVILSIQIGRAV